MGPILPTILEVTGIRVPDTVDGIAQKPIERIVVSVNPAGRFCVLAAKEVIKAIPLLVQDAAFREGRFEMGPVKAAMHQLAAAVFFCFRLPSMGVKSCGAASSSGRSQAPIQV